MTYIVHVTAVVEGDLERIEELINEYRYNCLEHQPGMKGFYVCRPVDHPNVFLYTQIFEDIGAHRAHIAGDDPRNDTNCVHLPTVGGFLFFETINAFKSEEGTKKWYATRAVGEHQKPFFETLKGLQSKSLHIEIGLVAHIVGLEVGLLAEDVGRSPIV